MAFDDTWSLATGEDKGKPLIFRIRNNPPSFARKEVNDDLRTAAIEVLPPQRPTLFVFFHTAIKSSYNFHLGNLALVKHDDPWAAHREPARIAGMAVGHGK